MMITSLLANLAVILFMHILMSSLLIQANQLRYSVHPTIEKLVVIGIISTSTIILLYLPIEIDGYKFDLRTIPLFFASLFHGWIVSLPILVISSVWRMTMGGVGAAPGTFFTMVLPTLFGLLFAKMDETKYRYGKMIGLSTVVWIIAFGSLLLMPNGLWMLQQFMFTHYLMFILTVVTLYTLIINTLKQLEIKKQLRFYAHHDPMTGLYNLRYFLFKIGSQTVRPGHNWLVMLDIDYFKKINDTYGHLSGDKVLKEVADILLKHALASKRKMIVARYGGEEFICYVHDLTENQLLDLLENIRCHIESRPFLSEENVWMNRITISAGYAPVQNQEALKMAMKLADQALYKSKAQGRNQIQSASL